MTRECDHFDEDVAEMMSLVDHDFTGADVRVLNAQVASIRTDERARVLAEVQGKVDALDSATKNYGEAIKRICAALGTWEGSWLDAACERLKRGERD
jgi:hypothetical protein